MASFVVHTPDQSGPLDLSFLDMATAFGRNAAMSPSYPHTPKIPHILGRRETREKGKGEKGLGGVELREKVGRCRAFLDERWKLGGWQGRTVLES